MVAVLTMNGIPLMPTTNRHARKLLKNRRAEIASYRPVFTIRLVNRKIGDVQPIEYTCDTGYLHVGVSIKSEKHEFVSRQYDLLSDETKRHDDRRQYRRMRRARKRYRAPRFDNRRVSDGWLAPSIRNKLEQQEMLFCRFRKLIPITSASFEMGKFDTQLLKAQELGEKLPEGTDYQRGARYQHENLRNAVFARDHYTCLFCGRGIENQAKLHVHHLGYLNGDHSDRMENLATACEKCHTPKNHKPGGILYGAKPKLKPLTGATFMTTVRWRMFEDLKRQAPEIDIRVCYGSGTKLARRELGIPKSHANDAYAMGVFHPRHRAHTEVFQKCRRNNRVLEKFYDAKYIDLRDDRKKGGQQLFCGRSCRNKTLNTENLHSYRGRKLSKGRRSIRRKRYCIRPGDLVFYDGKRHTSVGAQNCGQYIKLDTVKVVSAKKIRILYHAGGYLPA